MSICKTPISAVFANPLIIMLIRQNLPDTSRCTRENAWRRGFEKLRTRNLSFDQQIYYPRMEECYELACAFPETQVILNHTGMQVDGPEHFESWCAAMKGLSRRVTWPAKCPGLAWGLAMDTWEHQTLCIGSDRGVWDRSLYVCQQFFRR